MASAFHNVGVAAAIESVESLNHRAAATPFTADFSGTEIPEAGLFVLPGGYVADDGLIHCEVELSPLTGRLEELLANVLPHACSASAVTALLTACVNRVGTLATVNAELVGDLSVGDREYLLLRLRQMAFGSAVEIVRRCANPDCGKPMDIAFSLADLAIECKATTARYFKLKLSAVDFAEESDGASKGEASEYDDCEVEFRLPTGADQEALAAGFRVNQAVAVNQLLTRCVRRVGTRVTVDEKFIAKLPTAAREKIAAAMERFAPQVAIELDLTCPECRTSFVADLDFTEFFLAEMMFNTSRLEREVHFLARHYHWSEQDILSLTRKKRQRYVELLQEENEQFG